MWYVSCSVSRAAWRQWWHDDSDDIMTMMTWWHDDNDDMTTVMTWWQWWHDDMMTMISIDYISGFSYAYFANYRVEWMQASGVRFWGRLSTCDDGATRLEDCYYRGGGEYGFTNGRCSSVKYQLATICHNQEGEVPTLTKYYRYYMPPIALQMRKHFVPSNI